MEEEHRRILKENLEVQGHKKPKKSFLDLICEAPDFGNPDCAAEKRQATRSPLRLVMPFLLDTNVISELRLGARAAASVLAWRRSLAHEETYISVLVLGEMRQGVEKKRPQDPVAARVFERWMQEVEATKKSRILQISREICDAWGRLSAKVSVGTIDGLLTATAGCHGLTVATRNTKDFQKCGVDFFNPFEE